MRFIGNKEKLLENIYQIVTKTGIKDGSFYDFFAGTSNVGKHFKKRGFLVYSSDLLFSSYVLQRAYIENNDHALFSKLLPIISDKHKKLQLLASPLDIVIDHLNSLDGIKGFIYENYTEEGTRDKEHVRKYFISDNGAKIDAIRQKIESWYQMNLVTENEYYILLACLIESVPFYANISGVYAAFLKHYDPRAIKPFKLRSIELLSSRLPHKAYNKNSMELIDDINVDILYLDPPYNERQYAPNYHILETISKYDMPVIKGVTGLRNYSAQKSTFCRTNQALDSLNQIAKKANYKYLLLSYNSEGIMPTDSITDTLEQYGTVKIYEINYRRFKSNSNGDAAHKKHVQEQVYLLKRK